MKDQENMSWKHEKLLELLLDIPFNTYYIECLPSVHLPTMQKTPVLFLGRDNPLEKG